MFNKKNFRALAVAATLALATTTISALPAAADSGQFNANLTLTSAVGGSKYTVPKDTTFTLQSTVSESLVTDETVGGQPITHGNYAPDFSYAIFNPSQLSLSIEARRNLAGHSDEDFASSDSDLQVDGNQEFAHGTADTIGSFTAASPADSHSTTGKYAVVHPPTSYDVSTRVVFKGAVNGQSPYVNALNVTSATAGSVNVIAFLDENNNGRIDGSEYVSTTRTITWSASRSATVTINEMVVGSAAANISATLGGSVNDTMVAVHHGGADGQYGIGLKKSGVAVSLNQERYATDQDDLYFDFDNTRWKLNTALEAVATAGSYVATVYYNGTAIGSSTAYTVAQGTSAAVDAVIIDGPAASSNWATEHQASAGAVISHTDVRAGTKQVTLRGRVVDSNNVVVAEATKVKVTVLATNLDSSSSISVGGKTLTHGNTVTYETTTASDGTFGIAISSNTGLTGDSVVVTASALGLTSWKSGADTLYLNWQAEALDRVYIEESISTGGNYLAIKPDSAFKLSFVALDQFGQLWNKADFRITVADNDNEVSLGATSAISNGKAVVNLTDNDTDNSTPYALDWVVETRVNSNWAVSGNVNFQKSGSIVIYTDNRVASSITVSGGDDTITYADFVAHDFRYSSAASTDLAVDGGSDYSTVSGIVTNSAGLTVAGQLVTLSAAGDVAFIVSTPAGDIVTKGSATVRTDSSGSYSARLYSHKSGNIVVSTKVGSVSASDTIAFGGVSVNRADAKLTITKVGAVTAGAVVGLTIGLSDKWGNLSSAENLDILASVEGNAYLTSYALKTTAGVANTTMVLGAAATGATVTAKYAYASGKYITKVLSIGKATATVKAGIKKLTVTVANVAGRKIEVLVNNKVKASLVSTGTVAAFDVKAKTGKRTVVVKVSGKVIFTKVKTVK